MSCNCEGITCPCGIPCTCPSSPCGCTDCKNSAKHVCQLCLQQINHSSEENTCRCFMVDSAGPETRVSQQRSNAKSFTTQLEKSSRAQVSGGEVRAVSRTNVTKDSDAQITTDSRVKVKKDSDFPVTGLFSTKVREDSSTRVTTDSRVKVKEVSNPKVKKDSDFPVTGLFSTKVKKDCSARVTTDSSSKVKEISGAQVEGGSTSYGYGICPTCGKKFYTVPVSSSNMCIECLSLPFVTPVLPCIVPSVIPIGTNCASNMMLNAAVSLPQENPDQQIGGHGVGLNQPLLENSNVDSLENKEDFIKDWLNKTKLFPYGKDQI